MLTWLHYFWLAQNDSPLSDGIFNLHQTTITDFKPKEKERKKKEKILAYPFFDNNFQAKI